MAPPKTSVESASRTSSDQTVEGVIHITPSLKSDQGLVPPTTVTTPPQDDVPTNAKIEAGIAANGGKFRTMSWWQATVVMIAETVSLGILSLPACLAKLGFVPGGILILFLGLVSTYTGYALYQFKMAYPHVNSYADAGDVVGGRVGKWIADIMMMLMLIFIMAAHILTFSVMLNVLSSHAACSLVFTVVGLVVCIIFTLPRALRTTSYFSILSCLSIVAAAFLALINIASTHHGVGDTHIVPSPLFTSWAMGSVATGSIVIAFSGHLAYFTIISEMEQPKQFPKALCVTQISTTTLYMIVGVVIYYYAGQNVRSPALTSVSPLVSKIAYGIAIPTIIVAGVIAAMVASKSVYARVWQSQPEVTEEDSVRSWLSWIAIILGVWVLAFVVANAIPVFGQLIGLLGSAVGTWISLGMPAMAWLWLHYHRGAPTWDERLYISYGSSRKQMALAYVNAMIIVICAVLCISGVYGSIKDIIGNPPERHPFSCANNAN